MRQISVTVFLYYNNPYHFFTLIADPTRMKYWTSGYAITASKDWIWASTGYAFTYTAWHSTQPTENPKQNVTVLYPIAGIVNWHDDHPTVNAIHYPLCERVKEFTAI